MKGLELNAFVALFRCTEAIRKRVNTGLSDAGLTESQLGVLEALYHKGPMTQRMLADKILRSTSNLTTVLDNLEKRGLITRDKNPADGRSLIAYLTEKGTQTVSDNFPAHEKRIREAMSELSDEELLQLSGICKKLGKAVEGEH